MVVVSVVLLVVQQVKNYEMELMGGINRERGSKTYEQEHQSEATEELSMFLPKKSPHDK